MRRYIAPPDERDIVPREATRQLFDDSEERSCAHCGEVTSDIWLDGFCGPCHGRGDVECRCAAIQAERAAAAVPRGPEGTMAVRTPGLRKGDVVVDRELAELLRAEELRVEDVRRKPWGYQVAFAGARPRRTSFPRGRWFHVRRAS